MVINRYSLRFKDSINGLVLGDAGKVLVTSDGGDSFSLLKPVANADFPFFALVSFLPFRSLARLHSLTTHSLTPHSLTHSLTCAALLLTCTPNLAVCEPGLLH